MSDPDATLDASTSQANSATAEPAPTPEEMADFAELPTIDRANYIVRGAIAQGGVGRVLEARDRRLGRRVAIKELLPKNRDRGPRFEREARITARLQHPSIIHVYEAGTWPGGEPFYAMNHVVGRSLDRVIGDKPTFESRLGLLRNVITAVDALAYAHAEGVIHRDLKPSNVLVGNFGETVVIDWGLAKDLSRPAAQLDEHESRSREPVSAEGSPLETSFGSIVGTPGYMPPEQARGEPVDRRADVYSLGAMLYHVLSGAAPYRGPSQETVLAAVLSSAPPPVREREPDVPIDLAAIVDKAMARDPANRYRDAGELAADLKRFETGQLVAARHYSVRQRVWRFATRHRLIISFAIALLVIGSISVARILASNAEANEQRLHAEHRRIEADEQRQVAEKRRAALLLEQGRIQLTSGHAGRALAHLEQALRLGEDGPVTRFLIAEARRSFASQSAAFDVGGTVRQVAFSPAGGELVTTSSLGRVTLWKRDGSSHRDLLVHHYGTRTLAYSADGSHLVTAGDGAAAQLWAIATGTPRSLDHLAAIYSVEFDRGGRRVATASSDGSARIWDVETASCIQQISPANATPVHLARFSHDGKRLLTATGERLDVWPIVPSRCSEITPPSPNTATGEQGVPVYADRDLVDATFSPDDTLVATASQDGTLAVVEATTRRALLAVREQPGTWKRVLFSPDGSLLLAFGTRTPRVWRIAAGTVTFAYELVGHDDVIEAAAFSPDGRRIATASRDLSIRVWDASSGDPRGVLEGHDGAIDTIAFSSDGSELASGSDDGSMRIWSLGLIEGSTVSTLSRPAIAIAGRGQRLIFNKPGECAVAISGDDEIAITSDHRAVVRGPSGARTLVGEHGCAVAVTGDEREIAVGGTDGAVRIYRAADGALLQTLQGHRKPIQIVAFGGERLLTASLDHTAVIWNVASGSHEPPIELTRPIRAAALSPDGSSLVLASDESTRIYRIAAATSVPLDGSTLAIRWVGYTADGSRVVTVSGRELRIWDATTGKLVALRMLAGRLTAASALRGDAIVLASEDLRVHVETLGIDGSSPTDLNAFVGRRVPWKIVNDVAVRSHADVTRSIPALAGDSFQFVPVKVGNPRWHVADVIQYTSETGGMADNFSKFEAYPTRLLVGHAFNTTQLIWGPGEPHAPPYDGELGRRLQALGAQPRTRFKLADWAPPNSISVMMSIAPDADAPQGKTSDYTHGPMIPNDKFPLRIDGELRRDGIVADPDLDTMYPRASVFDPSYEGWSHTILLFGDSTEYLSAAMRTGNYLWHFRLRDVGGDGWDLSIGPLVIE